jgi:hypothetical protein
MIEENGVMWYMKEGQVCEGCAKLEIKCFWRNSPWAKACHHCNANKKMCMVGAGKEGLEAGLSKKRRVTKGKEKEKSELDLDAGVALLKET